MASRDFAIHPLALENFEIRTVDVLRESNVSDGGMKWLDFGREFGESSGKIGRFWA